MGVKRIDGLLSERIDNELLVFNQATGEGHALNEAAAASRSTSMLPIDTRFN